MRYDGMKTLILYFSKVVLITKRLAVFADLIFTIALPLPSCLMNKIFALVISDTILDKTEMCDGRFIRIYINCIGRFIRVGIKIIRSAWYNLFGLKPDESIHVIRNGERTHNGVTRLNGRLHNLHFNFMRVFLLHAFFSGNLNKFLIRFYGEGCATGFTYGPHDVSRSNEVSAIKLKSAAATILEYKFVDKTCPFTKLEGTEGLRKEERIEESSRHGHRSNRPT